MSENFERLGNYILLEKINAGGMAEVYLAKSVGANGVNKFLAIKRILPQFADNREFIDMFKEEAKIAVNLHHNNVVSIIDFKASRNQLYLVMEYVQGQNLRQVLQQKKKKGLTLSLDFIVYLIREVAAGLDYAHRCVDKTTGKTLNIIHRDMSPQNVMVSYDGEIKIVDFGIAKTETANESTRVGTLKGKFSYMSPEQAEGLIVDQVSDIFSLGIILWELVADDRLFVANNEMNILKRIKECDIPDLRRVNPTVPAELDRIVKKTLMKDKSLRYQSATDLQKDLTRFLNKEYPDFTPSDFSTFMKFLFENEYSLAQERLVNYAKLDLGSVNELSETTQFTRSSYHVPPAPNGVPAEPPENLEMANPFPELPHHTPASNNPGIPPIPPGEPQQGQQATPPQKPRQTSLAGLNQNTGLKKPVAPVRRQTTTTSYATRSGVTSTGIRYKTPTSPPTSEFAKGLLSLFIIVVLFGGAYLLAPKKLRTKVSDQFVAVTDYWLKKRGTRSKTPPRNGGSTDPTIDGASEQASLATTYKVLVKSTPGRARIYINNQDQGLTTPATVEVEANKPFTLTLVADGYLPYNTRMTPGREGQEISADLTQIRFGYININVLNAGVDTIIYINNLELKDRPPITKYPVQAGKPISVRAVHPFTGSLAETSVTVGVDEKKTIDLILTNPKRQKSEKRK